MAFHHTLHHPPSVYYLKGDAAEGLLLEMLRKGNCTLCCPRLLQPSYPALLSPDPTLLTPLPGPHWLKDIKQLIGIMPPLRNTTRTQIQAWLSPKSVLSVRDLAKSDSQLKLFIFKKTLLRKQNKTYL